MGFILDRVYVGLETPSLYLLLQRSLMWMDGIKMYFWPSEFIILEVVNGYLLSPVKFRGCLHINVCNRVICNLLQWYHYLFWYFGLGIYLNFFELVMVSPIEWMKWTIYLHQAKERRFIYDAIVRDWLISINIKDEIEFLWIERWFLE